VNETDTQLREWLERAVGDPPRHIRVPAVRRGLVHRRITETAAAVVAVVAVGVGGTAVAALTNDEAVAFRWADQDQDRGQLRGQPGPRRR
jgi:hypothetical protein